MGTLTIVQGEFDTILNGLRSSVTIQLVCKNQEDAEEVLKTRAKTYKNLHIKQITRAQLLNNKETK